MTDTAIEDPHSEAGAHVGQAATMAFGRSEFVGGSISFGYCYERCQHRKTKSPVSIPL